MAPRTKKCASCGEKLPPDSPDTSREYEDSIHYFNADGDFIYASREAETIHTDKSVAHPSGLLCKGCNTDAGRIWRRDPTYLRDLKDARDAKAAN